MMSDSNVIIFPEIGLPWSEKTPREKTHSEWIKLIRSGTNAKIEFLQIQHLMDDIYAIIDEEGANTSMANVHCHMLFGCIVVAKGVYDADGGFAIQDITMNEAMDALNIFMLDNIEW